MARIGQGKPRTYGGGRRPWRAALHSPTDSYPTFRVVFKECVDAETDVWKWTARTADDEAEARRMFQQTERALDGLRALPARQRVAAGRTIAALGDKYIAESKANNKGVRTVEGRESKLNAHILPTIGELPVSAWRDEHSRKVLERARRTVKSATGLRDVRTVLAAMRDLAHHLEWLDAGINPLARINLPRADPGEGYVSVEMRPERHSVDAMARAADLLSGTGPCAGELVDGKPIAPLETVARLPLFGEKVRLAGYGALRLGEQNALRAIDVFFDTGLVNVNGSWTQPRAADSCPFRGPVKNHRVHDVPMPRSWLNRMLPVAAVALGLEETASQQQVLNAQRAARLRRTNLARESGDPKLTWYNFPGDTPEAWKGVDATQECWLFIDTTTGVPGRSEQHNDRWHKVRRWVDRHDPEHAWPKHVDYRNLRHHAATFWHDELNREWVDVANYLGDKLTTVLEHYVLPGAESLRETAALLENY